MRHILIAGSGKMAMDLGLFFLQRQCQVFFVSDSGARLENIAQKIDRARRRLERFVPEKKIAITYDCFQRQSPDIPVADIIIETSRESLQVKRDVFESLARTIKDHTLLFSNSSSILPHTIHPRCLGAHFFFPVEMNRIVELIVTSSYQTELGRARRFLRENQCTILEQDKRSAFIINRLLVPLQAFCFKGLMKGVSAETMNNASKSALVSFGQLSFMDAIGLDVIASAVTHYDQLAPPLVPADIDNMCNCLQQLLKMGKRGDRNRDGLLAGIPLPWPARLVSPGEELMLAERCADILEKSCREAIRQRLVKNEQLRSVLESIFYASELPVTYTL